MVTGISVVRKLKSGYLALQKQKTQPPQQPFMTTPITAVLDIEKALLKGGLIGGEGEEGRDKKLIKVKVEGLELPEVLPKTLKLTKLEEEAEKGKLSFAYPLIPKNPRKDEPVLAYVKIFWDDSKNKYAYQVVEPVLSAKLQDMLKRIKELLEEKFDVDFSKMKRLEASEYLYKQIDDILNYYNFELSGVEMTTLRYYIARDFIGLGKIEPLLQDDFIEDISCDGLNIPVFIYHRNPELGSVMTNVAFQDGDELDSFVIRLAQLAGKSISIAKPLANGSLPDGSRLQATLGTDIARRGSNFTIRKFTQFPLTPIHLLNYGTVDVKTLAYLWLAIDYGRSMLLCGGTATGKTSLLNVLSLFIRGEKKIVSIEDTSELKLPHSHWVPTVARTVIAGEEKVSEVDMFDLLKESLRQRPDYIIVGEVRGKEAYIMFQQIATGHPSLATIHAEDMDALVNRLTTPPISLPPGLIASLDLVVFLTTVKYRDKYVRRINEILEVTDFDMENKRPTVNQVFKWNAAGDKFLVSGKSFLLKNISELSGVSEQEIKDELERRMVVLNWMKEKNITDYRDVYRILTIYYSSPQKLLSIIIGEE